MPYWIYFRGFALMLFMGSRPTFLLGHAYAHGVPQYFPVAFALKSAIAFLLLLVVVAITGWYARKTKIAVIPKELLPHWRVLVTGFFVFLAACLLSRLNISIRHFMMP